MGRMETTPKFTFGSVLSRGFTIYFRNFISYTALSTIIYLPALLFFLLLLEGILPYSVPAAIAMAILTVILGSLVTLTLFQATWEGLRGRPVSLRRSVSAAFARFLPAFGVAIVAGVLIALGTLLLVIPGLLVMVYTWVAIPVCLVEREGVVKSISRSGSLVEGHGWSVFGIILVFGLLEGVPEKVLERGFENGSVSLAAYFFVPLAISVFVSAASAAVAAVGYHDLRVTKENIDLEQLASVFD